MMRPRSSVSERQLVWAAAALFFPITTTGSAARWLNFDYRTFDLAYYVQALWQLGHGRLWSSLLAVPLMGNHVEPIIFLLAPLFALLPHPMTLVVVQNAALAAMAPLGFRLARLLGNGSRAALPLTVALLTTPATGYIALHEFHPEALSAPLIIAMVLAYRLNALAGYWLAVLALLACKENMAALVAGFCLVEFVRNRRREGREPWRWHLGPLTVALGWFLLCAIVITPALNQGKIDYLALYSRPGAAFAKAVIHGNLIWGLLLPFLALPLLRPWWLLIASPLFLQHLLSWRSSEWTIYFHYAAPLLPLLWIAAAEALARPRLQPFAARISLGVLAACCIAQALIGPAGDLVDAAVNWNRSAALRGGRNAFLHSISDKASVVAPLPYLSHLARRENLSSLHFILKGLNTLGRSIYTPPPPTDYVLVDYSDDATFDSAAGFFHPQMATADRQLIASSEHLLHDFLVRARWNVQASDSLTLFQKTSEPQTAHPSAAGLPSMPIAEGSELLHAALTTNAMSASNPATIAMRWRFNPDRTVFPWMYLSLTTENGDRRLINAGLCGIQVAGGEHEQRWLLTSRSGVPRGTYTAELLFFDQSRRAWAQAHSLSAKMEPLAPPVPLGRLRVD